MDKVKKKYNEEHKKNSYVELAGKVAFVLEAQDGRCAVPGIQILGMTIILTFFDQGSSVSTYPLDIHQHPEQFLHILLGVTFTDGISLGFDPTISPAQNTVTPKTVTITNLNTVHRACCSHMWECRLALVGSNILVTPGYRMVPGSCESVQGWWRYDHSKTTTTL